MSKMIDATVKITLPIGDVTVGFVQVRAEGQDRLVPVVLDEDGKTYFAAVKAPSLEGSKGNVTDPGTLAFVLHTGDKAVKKITSKVRTGAWLFTFQVPDTGLKASMFKEAVDSNTAALAADRAELKAAGIARQEAAKAAKAASKPLTPVPAEAQAAAEKPRKGKAAGGIDRGEAIRLAIATGTKEGMALARDLLREQALLS